MREVSLDGRKKGLGSSTPMDLAQTSQSLVRRFLQLTDPTIFENINTEQQQQQPEDPITDWDILYTTQQTTSSNQAGRLSPSIVVRSHPAPDKHLFSVQSVIPNIDARQFWTLMANSYNRHLWDSTSELSNVQCWLAEEFKEIQNSEEHQATARKLSARIELLRFGSIMFVANKRDMVLLCVDTQLPSSDGRLRLLSASCSVDMQDFPPRKGYNRFHLNIGGFLVEDLGSTDSVERGIRVTQVSDLGEMATWVPASIVRMVASTMVPKSMNAIAKIASKMRVPKAFLIKGDGFSGEGWKEEECDLCELGGGSWQSQRHLPPILSPKDLSHSHSISKPQEVGVIASGPRALSVLKSNEYPASPTLATSEDDARIQEMTRKKLSFCDVAEEAPDRSQSEDTLCTTDASSQCNPVTSSESGSDLVIDSKRSSTKREYELGDEHSASSGSYDLKDNEVEMEAIMAEAEEENTSMDETLVNLFSETEAQDCTQMLSKHTRNFHRMSLSQRETHRRISAFLVNGSDSLALAIAPGARDSMKVVARIMNSSMVSLGEEETDAVFSSTEPIRLRLCSSASTLASPTTTKTSAGGQLDLHSFSRDSGRSSSAASSATLCESDQNSLASSSTWTSSITKAPYTVALGILHLATWIATRPVTSYTPTTIVKQDKIGLEDNIMAETSRPTLSALSVTRHAYSQRDVMRRKTKQRPKSHYRGDDTKLHPFPLINNENLPPLGIATGNPASILQCEPARQQQPPFTLEEHTSSWWSAYF